MGKVIHVHLTKPIEGTRRRDWYFSSITAVYTVLTAEQVGASLGYLLHAGLSGNGTVITKRAIIKQSTLLSGRRCSHVARVTHKLRFEEVSGIPLFMCDFADFWH